MDKRSNKKKKYLFLITGMVMGGAERVMATIANEFVRRGNEILIVTMKEANSAYKLDSRVKIVGAMGTAQSNIKIIRTLELIYSGIKGFFFYLYYLKSFQPDIVLSFLTNTNLLAVITRRLFVRNIPVIISERADPLKRGNFTRKLCEKIYPMSDSLVCQSEKVGKYFSNISTKTNIKIIPNPVNLECVSQNIPEKRRNVIIGIGRLSNQKNFSLLIDSFHEIKEEFPDFILEIYGQGTEQDNLDQKIRTLNLENKVFLRGIKNNIMQSVYDARLFVLSSDYEGFPNVLIEAMASGLPVISTDFPTGIARELIKDGINGYVVPMKDKKELANAMRKILKDNELQEIMSNNNRLIVQTLDKDKIINQWLEVFDNTDKF